MFISQIVPKSRRIIPNNFQVHVLMAMFSWPCSDPFDSVYSCCSVVLNCCAHHCPRAVILWCRPFMTSAVEQAQSSLKTNNFPKAMRMSFDMRPEPSARITCRVYRDLSKCFKNVLHDFWIGP